MKRLTILLVEDNEDDRFLTMRALKKLPVELEFIIAKSGDEALRNIIDVNDRLPDLVLLDLQLPKISGTTLLATIREKYGNEQLPVVIISSSDNPLDINNCLKLGISGYLPKPLDATSIASLIGCR